MIPLRSALSFLFGAACGAIPFGYLAGRIQGLDIRHHGSGNIGFTNVQRILGWTWAVPVLLLDLGKGLAPTACALPLGLSPPLVALGAVLGHVFCPWLRFRGGKGVATTLGVTAILCPWAMLCALGLYLLMLVWTGFVSLGSLSFALALPLATALIYRQDASLPWLTLGLAVVILVRHWANLRRLRRRAEPRLSLWLKLFRPGPDA